MAKCLHPLFSESARGSVEGISFKRSHALTLCTLRHTPSDRQSAIQLKSRNNFKIAKTALYNLSHADFHQFISVTSHISDAQNLFISRKLNLLNAGFDNDPIIQEMPTCPPYSVAIILPAYSEQGGWYFELNYNFDPDWTCLVDYQIFNSDMVQPDKGKWKRFFVSDATSGVADLMLDYGMGRFCYFRLTGLNKVTGITKLCETYSTWC